MTTVLLRRAALALALTSLLAACGKGDEETPADAETSEASDTATVPATAASAPATTEPAADGALTMADLDAYTRGMTQELAVLKAAADKAAQARTKGDKDAEASAMMEMATLDTDTEGARAAGLDKGRYAFLKQAIDTALGKAEMLAAMSSQADDSAMADLPPEQRKLIEDGRAEMKAAFGDPYAGMAPDVVEALKARQAELARLRAEVIAVRLNAGK